MPKKSKGIKKEYTVAWILKDKKIVKFKEDADDVYSLADNVIEYLDGIEEGVSVNVTLDNNTVIFMQQKKETSKTEVSSDSSVKEWTVKAITSKRDVVKFEEGEVSWYIIPENIREQFTSVKAKDVVRVTIGTTKEKGKEKATVLSIETVSSVKNEETKNTNYTSNSKKSYRDEEATDKRTALMTAKDIIVAMIGQGKCTTTSNIKDGLQDLTKTCYEAIRNL